MQHYHYLTIEQREHLDALMHERITSLRAEIAEVLRKGGGDMAADAAREIESSSDAPTAALENALATAALEREAAALRDMLAARVRLHTPEFGVCADCGADIPYVRLEAMPTATRCVACQARFEHAPGADGTPSR
ncbi:MAG TPA: TraR/DksA C4-type zinc finger protein [Burkholderiales bacterium]|nr:TraR/DksA C4-type zinc finger protein [Burkholderiales bacterium]